MILGSFVLVACGTSSADSPDDAGSKDERKTLTITDELGREVEVKVPIKAVYPDLWYQDELVRAIGAGDTITAVDDTADPAKNPYSEEYFDSFKDLPTTGNYDEPNWEEIVESGAEVALLRRNSPVDEAIAKLEPFGIKVIVITGWDPVVTRKFLPTLGELFGHEEEAEQVASIYDDIKSTLDTKLADVDPKKVYFENNADYITSVPGSGWHDAIVWGGGKNIFDDVNVGDDASASVHQYEVDPVEIINRDPDVIVHVGVDGETSGYEPWSEEIEAEQAKRIADRPGWADITAVKNKEVYVFNNFYFSALGKMFGALAVAKQLYPEEFADVELDSYFDRWVEAQGVTPKPVSDYFYKLDG
jgi:iron complex transport system substrate-binding protein